MKKLLLILIAFAPIFAMAQFEAGEYINSDTLKNKGVNVYVDHLKNFMESDSGKILMHRNKSLSWENMSDIGVIKGSGTANYIPIFDTQNSVKNSMLYENGSMLMSTEEIAITSPNFFRSTYGNYGTFWRNDGTNLYLLLTNYGNQLGTYNNYRPLTLALSTGRISMNNLSLIDNDSTTTILGNSSPLTIQSGRSSALNYDNSITFKLLTSKMGGISCRYTAYSGGIYGSDLIFFNRQNTLGDVSEALRINRYGRVGIGNSSPSQKLHISGNILADTCFTTKNSSLINASNYYVRGDSTKAYIDRKVVGGSGMTWPSTAGIANYAGSSAWGTSITTSAGLSGVLTDETGSGSAVFATSPTITSPTVATSLTGSYLTASTLLSANASKQITSLSTTYYPNLAEIAYVKGVTSSIQSQLDSKGTVKGSGDTNNQLAYWTNATTLSYLPLTIYPTLAELSYVKGVTSSIQTQINAKQSTLVSGTNLKTVNGYSLLGSGDLSVSSQWTTDTDGLTYTSNVGIGASSRSDVKVYGYSTTSTIGVYGNSSTGVGVEGVSGSSYGIFGYSTSSSGVHGNSSTGYGVYGVSGSNYGGVFAGLGVNISSGGLYISGTTRISSTGVFTPSNGVSGSFKSSDNKTITVTNGIITSITTP